MTTILITGTTGFVGKHFLPLALASPQVAKVISVTRKPLPADLAWDPTKLLEIVLSTEEEWLNWPSSAVSQIADVDACVWCLGVVPFQNTSSEDLKKVSIDYVQAGIKALLKSRESSSPESHSSSSSREPPRFILLSGALAEQDPNAKLWFMDEYRKARGGGEVAALEFEREKGRSVIQVAIVGLGRIIPDGSWLQRMTDAIVQYLHVGLLLLPVKDLNKTLLRIALYGTEKTKLSNEDMRNGSI